MNERILNPDYLEKERGKMQNEWAKKAFYGFIKGLFRQKTTFERYGLLMLVLQLITLFCSYISYVTGHAFIETYIGAWVKSPASVFWASVVCIVLLEAVKILAAMPLFLSIVRLQGFRWGSGSLVALTFLFSMYISYNGAEDKVMKGAAPTLVNTAEIASYYDNKIESLQDQKKGFLNDSKYQNSKGQVFHTVLKTHVQPLTAEITRLSSLRDEKIKIAELKNAGIEQKHNEYTTADARTMAFIALGADGVKLIISLLTAWFLVAAAKDYEIINNTETRQGEDFGESAFGLLKSMPKTEAPQDSSPTPRPQNIQFKIPPKDSNFESIDKTRDSIEVVVAGFNKGQPMTKRQIQKQIGNYKSRLKAIEAGSKKHGRADRAAINIEKLQKALNRFNQ